MKGFQTNPESSHENRYVPFIDGLRTIAVLAVIIYHAFPKSLSGGFIGVDIFFVISGYLITGILMRDAQSSEFSILNFYDRRIRRLFPALIVMLIFCLVIGGLGLFALEFKALAIDVMAGALFYSNILNWFSAGYFDRDSAIKPLLHLWSLGVEEQFYFLWPWVVYFGYRFFKKNVKWMVTILIVLSFAINLMTVNRWSSFAFYLPFTRLWELGLGSLLALNLIQIRNQVAKEATSLLGVAFLILSFYFINSSFKFPGYWALGPTLGTFLILLSGSQSRMNTLIANSAFQYIGKISYPLYLWHWPLFAFSRIFISYSLSTTLTWFLILISFVLAVLTHELIEKPFKSTRNTKRLTWILISIMTGMIGLSTLIKMEDGFPQRLGKYAEAENLSKQSQWHFEYTRPECPLPETYRHLANSSDWCLNDIRGEPDGVVLGDSHANAIYPGLVSSSSKGSTWTLIARPSCSLLGDAYGENNELCLEFFKQAAKSISESPSIHRILLAQASRILFNRDKIKNEIYIKNRSSEFVLKYDALITQLEKANKQVYFLIDNPDITPAPASCVQWPPLRRTLLQSDDCSISRELANLQLVGLRDALRELRLRHPNFQILDPTFLLCDDKECPVLKGVNAMYADSDHYSDFGTKMVGGWIVNQLKLEPSKIDAK